MIPEISIVLPAPVTCPRPLYAGTLTRCCRRFDHEGPHEAWEDHGDRCALAFRWYDCPGCGRSCSVAAMMLWGGCYVVCSS